MQQQPVEQLKAAFSSARTAADELNVVLQSNQCPTRPLNLTVSGLTSLEQLIQKLGSNVDEAATAKLEEAAQLLADVHKTAATYGKQRLVKFIRAQQSTLWRGRACCEEARGLVEAALKSAEEASSNAEPGRNVVGASTESANREATAAHTGEMRFDRFDDIDDDEMVMPFETNSGQGPVSRIESSMLYGMLKGGKTTEKRVHLPVDTFPCGAVVTCITLSPNLVFIGLEDGRICLTDLKHKRALKYINCFEDSVTAIATTRDESKIVAGSARGEGGVWLTLNEKRIATFEGLKAAIRRIHVLKDQKSCGMEAADDTFGAWNFGNKRPWHMARQGGCKVQVILEPNEEPNFSGSFETTSDNFDETKGLKVSVEAHRGVSNKLIRKHDRYVVCISWKKGPPQRMVYGCRDGRVVVCDHSRQGYTEVCRLETVHEGTVRCLALVDGSYRVVTGSDDTTAIVWEASDVAYTHTRLRGHTAPVTCVAVSEDGETVVTGSKDGFVKIWKVQRQIGIDSLVRPRR